MNAVHLTNLRVCNDPGVHDLYVLDGKFITGDQLPDNHQQLDLGNKLVLPGLIETHLHLDKACILDRCQLREGTLQEAIAQTSEAKAKFDQQDVYKRGAKVIEQAIKQGTTFIRTHVEIDPVIGLQGFYAIQQLKKDYHWALDLQICVFPQEGMTNNPGTEELLRQALDEGADLLGGCPYTDSDADRQIEILFNIAKEYDCDLDFHLDFDLDTSWMSLDKVCRQAEQNNWQGRVTVGHVTKLSMLPPEKLLRLANQMSEAGVQVTVLPSTDLFLSGRDCSHAVPRGVAPLMPLFHAGVTCSISSNNIGNPFTPYGDASLIRQANLYANIAQLGTPDDMAQCLAWVSFESAKLLGLEHYGLQPGCQADFMVIDAESQSQVIAEIQPPLMGFKRGVQTFERPKASLFLPI